MSVVFIFLVGTSEEMILVLGWPGGRSINDAKSVVKSVFWAVLAVFSELGEFFATCLVPGAG
jgi:hypothetical protein